jgi:hypothetical protein
MAAEIAHERAGDERAEMRHGGGEGLGDGWGGFAGRLEGEEVCLGWVRWWSKGVPRGRKTDPKLAGCGLGKRWEIFAVENLEGEQEEEFEEVIVVRLEQEVEMSGRHLVDKVDAVDSDLNISLGALKKVSKIISNKR